jgi:hypothetical protein
MDKGCRITGKIASIDKRKPIDNIMTHKGSGTVTERDRRRKREAEQKAESTQTCA